MAASPVSSPVHSDTTLRDLSHSTLESRRGTHPAWKLLQADNAPLILGFLAETYLIPNTRTLPEPDLVDALDDYLERRRNERPGSYPKAASAYLSDWVGSTWLSKRYPPGSDTAQYEPSVAVEQAARFARSLTPQELVGTGSRLLVIQDLLRRIRVGGASDPQERVDELMRQRDQIDEEIARINAGYDTKLDDAAIREQYQLALGHGRELIGDMRTVEASVRDLDRDVRQRAATWDGPRGEFLATVFDTTEVIDRSDQGKTWQAFWRLLLDRTAQDELRQLVNVVSQLPALHGISNELGQILETELFHAAEATQRVYASLSSQLRTFVDDYAWTENRRIHDVLREFYTAALALRDEDIRALGSEIPALKATIVMPTERPLYTPRAVTDFGDFSIEDGQCEPDLTDVANLRSVDTARLTAAIVTTLAQRGGIATLGQVVGEHPLEEGLAELVGYLDLSSTGAHSRDSDRLETVTWTDDTETIHRTRIPTIVFSTTDSEDLT